MIEAARSIATDGQTIAKFVEMIAKHSTDPKYAMKSLISGHTVLATSREVILTILLPFVIFPCMSTVYCTHSGW